MPPPEPSAKPTQPPFRLRLFGSPRMEHGDGVLRLTNRQLFLLSLLAAHLLDGVEISRLIDLLWASGNEHGLRKQLQKDIGAIRTAAGRKDVILTRKGQYALNGELIRTELKDLEETLAEGRVWDAAALIDPGLLHAVRCEMHSPMASWTISRQTELRGRVRTAAVQAWTSARQRADWRTAEDAARALLTLDPDSEQALNKIMQVLALQGRPEEAEGMFASFTERAGLERGDGEGWRPDPSTEQLRERLPELGRWLGKGAQEESRAGSATLPLVGREEEMRRIGALLRAPPADGIQLIWITGERGMGKSRLAREAVAASSLPEARVLSAQCTAGERTFALAPLVSLISQRWVGEELASLPEPWQGTLLAWAPELERGDEGQARPDPGEDGALPVTRRAAHAFLQLFQHLASSRPLILFIDDLHLADQETQAVLEYVCRRWTDGSLTILGTGVEGVRPKTSEGFKLPQDPGLRIPLEPLSERQVLQLLDSFSENLEEGWLEFELNTPGVKRTPEWHLYRLTGGRPARLSSILQAVQTSTMPSLEPTCERFRRVLTELVSGLANESSADARDTLFFLICWRSTLSLPDLQAATGWEIGRVRSAVEELARAGLVSCEGTQIQFAHPVFGSILEARFDSTRMPAIHSRIASVLRSRGNRDAQVGRVRHLFLAGLSAEATAAAQQAALAAESEGRLEEALEILELASMHGSADPRVQVQISVRYAEGLLSTGRLDEAAREFDRSIQLSRRLPDTGIKLRARLGSLITVAFESKFADTDLLQPLQGLINEMQRTGLIDDLPTALDLRLRVLSRNGDIPGVRQTLSDLQQLSAWATHPVRAKLELLGHVDLLYRGFQEDDPPLPVPGIAAVAKADPDLALDTLNWQVILGIMAGEWGLEQNWTLRREAAECLKTSATPFSRFKLQLNLGVGYLEAGDLDGAEAAFGQAEAIMGDLPMPAGRSHLFVNFGELELRRRNYQVAKEAFSTVLAESPVLPAEPARNLALAGLSLSHLGLGQLGTARDYAERLPSVDTSYPFDHSLLALAQARVTLATGDRDKALRLLLTGAARLSGRFQLGWANLEIERIRLGGPDVSTPEKVADLLRQNQLTFLMSRYKAVTGSD